MISKNISILVPPGHYDELPDILHRIKYGEHIEHYETVRMRKDGTLVEVSVTVSPVKDKAGTVVGASSIKRDISKEKHLEKALQVRQEELEITGNWKYKRGAYAKIMMHYKDLKR